ncbi:MAG: Eco57I restriction-modification methylase domain-containing protein, partial [Thomasclavelia spiroformis]
MSIQKSKGAYYTSPQMVRLLKSRIEDILENKNDLIILEPSAGEGAFIKEIIEHPCFSQKWHIDAVDIDHRAISLLQKSYPHVYCYNEDFIDYSVDCVRRYDLIIGNPPYIKKNLYMKGQHEKIVKYFRENNYDFKGVTNLWAFFVIASTQLLNDSGVLAFVIPTEFLAVKYAEDIRYHLLKLFSSIEFITFEDLMFDTCKGQDTMLLVCRKQSVKRGVFFTTIPNASSQNVVSLQQLQRVEESKWSHYLLSAEEIDYLHRISQDCFPLSKYLSSAPG